MDHAENVARLARTALEAGVSNLAINQSLTGDTSKKLLVYWGTDHVYCLLDKDSEPENVRPRDC